MHSLIPPFVDAKELRDASSVSLATSQINVAKDVNWEFRPWEGRGLLRHDAFAQLGNCCFRFRTSEFSENMNEVCLRCKEELMLPPSDRCPKVLNCAHYFCQRCCGSMVSEARGGAKFIECGLCSYFTPFPEKGAPDP